MRLIVDTMLALLLIAVLGGILWYQRGQEQWLDKVTAVQEALRAVESKALYYGALGDVDSTQRGYAMRVDAAWFDPLPVNLLFADEARPWMDTVLPEDGEAFNPARITAEGNVAAFWYNPYRGIVRARVPMQLTQGATIELYNLVNGTSVRIEDVDWTDPRRIAQMKPPVNHKVELQGAPKIRPAADPPAASPLPKGRSASEARPAPLAPTSKLRQTLGD